MLLEKTCECCSSVFLWNGQGVGRFCKPACFYKSLEKRGEKECWVCKKIIVRTPSLLRAAKTVCSKECKKVIQSERLKGNQLTLREKSPRWKGGENIKNGRIQINSDPGKRMYRNRFNAEGALGRRLTSKEVVHHIDRNRLNDKIENLFLFRHQAAHLRWHAFLRRHPRVEPINLTSNLITV